MKAGLVNVNLNYKTVLAVGGLAALAIWYSKQQASETVDFIKSGEMGEDLYDFTHDANNNPTPIGRVFDWLAGIEKGVDY